MGSYISESFRLFEVAQESLNNFSDNKNVFICIIFSAIYIESVINDIIFYDKLLYQQYKNKLKDSFKEKENYDFDLYNEKKSVVDKIDLILNIKCIFKDKEYIELLHLFKIRNNLVHLKPIEQLEEGDPQNKTCRSAMNYLYKNLKLIDNPFAGGVFWTDVLMKKEVAEWALQVAIKSIEYLYNKTFVKPFGNDMLDYHCLRLKIGRHKKLRTVSSNPGNNH